MYREMYSSSDTVNSDYLLRRPFSPNYISDLCQRWTSNQNHNGLLERKML